MTYDEQLVLRGIKLIRWVNYLGVRGEIFTQCMELPNDPDVTLDGVDYENKAAEADVKDKIVPERIKPAHEKGSHCKALIMRGVKEINLDAEKFSSGRLYVQREMWDMTKDVVCGLIGFASLLSFKFYDYLTKFQLWIDKSFWRKICSDLDKNQHEFGAIVNQVEDHKRLQDLIKYLLAI